MRSFKKICPVILFVCLGWQTNAQDTLFWKPGTTLTWTDFRGEANFSVLYRMLSVTGLKYSYRITKQALHFKVDAFFLPLRSWKKYIDDSSLIRHEQLHFDITEFYARKLLRALKQLNSDEEQLHRKVDEIAAAVIEEKNLFQRKYDKETHYGSLKGAQKKWEVMVKKKLAEENSN